MLAVRHDDDDDDDDDSNEYCIQKNISARVN